MALVGVVFGFALAAALSVLTPVGEAGVADPSPGFTIDPLLLVPGACIAFAVVVLLGIWSAVVTSRTTHGHQGAARPSRVASFLSSVGAPASALIGVRHALERGRGRSAVPVGSALVGAVLAVTALTGTAVFGASLSHLTATPSLYGQSFDAWYSFNQTGTPSQNAELAAAVERPGIAAVTVGVGADVDIDGKVVFAHTGQSLRGPLLITASSGHIPFSPDQVALGSSTLRAVGAHIGSVVHVSSPNFGVGLHPRTFTVVGTTVFPPDFNTQGLGTGAVFMLSSLAGNRCPSGPSSAGLPR